MICLLKTVLAGVVRDSLFHFRIFNVVAIGFCKITAHKVCNRQTYLSIIGKKLNFWHQDLKFWG